MEEGLHSQQGIMFGANAFFNYQLCRKLIEKGLLSHADAASVMVETANMVRDASEDGSGKAYGETIAGRYEVFAGWLLGANPNL